MPQAPVRVRPPLHKNDKKMIRITGIIGEDVTLLDVIAAVKKEPEGRPVEVYVNSPGGYVDEGLRIYNYLRGLRHGCNTTCEGECASMGSIIFMAGKERRAGCEIMIHNPFITELRLSNATADDIQVEAERLRELQDTLAEVYIKTAKLDRNAIQPLMDDETWIDPAKAVQMGIATSIYTPLRKMQGCGKSGPIALAFGKEESQNTDIMKATEKILALAKRFMAGGVKALTLKAADGTDVYVEREEGEIEVGDTASPDGEFQLEDGRFLVIKDGRIEEIRTSTSETELNDLQRELELARATIAQQAAFIERYRSVIDDYEAKKGQSSGGFQAQGRGFQRETPKTDAEKSHEYAQKLLEERRKAREERKGK